MILVLQPIRAIKDANIIWRKALRIHKRLLSNSINSKLSLSDASIKLSTHQLTVLQLVKECYRRAKFGDDTLGLGAYAERASWTELEPLIQASQERYDVGKPKSLLDGIPVAIKANIAVRGRSLTAGSAMLTHPSTKSVYHADVSHRLLEDCGAILIGTTRLDEFGMGSLGTHHYNDNSNQEKLSITHNPIHYLQEDSPINDSPYRLVAGGSSSGSAVAVSYGSVLLALGTDTGGSIRLPSSWCPGVTGYKPTYGRISRYGVVSYASSLDTVGMLTATPQDAHLAFSCLVNHRDSLCRDSTASFFEEDFSLTEASTDMDLNGITVGIPEAFSLDPCPNIVSKTWEKAASILEEAGAKISIIHQSVIQPTTLQSSLSSYYVLACAEASSNLARYDGVRFGADINHAKALYPLLSQDSSLSDLRALTFGPEVIKRVLAGTAVLSSDRFHTHYEAAAKQRALLRREFAKAFEQNTSVMLVPTTMTSPPWINIYNDSNLPDETDLLANDVMTTPISLAGLPAISVPVDMEHEQTTASPDGMISASLQSMGFQLFGPPMSDSTVIRVASALLRK